MLNIVKQEYSITKNDQNSFKGHQSFLIWFTGLSGSGKSTIANELLNQLHKKGFHVYALDGDNIRFGLNKDLTFSTADRTENLRRIGEVSKLLIDAGIITIAAFVSPLIEHRESIKSIVGSDNFIEIFVNTPIEECEKRDVKGLYAKARKGEIKDFTGIDAPYEIPLSPNIEINTIQLSVEKAVEKIFDYLTDKLTIKQ
jgi:adenylylsulfate kinase